MSRRGALAASLLVGLGVVLYSILFTRADPLRGGGLDLARVRQHRQDLESGREKRRILAVTRVHKANAAAMASEESVVEFVRNSAAYATSVLVCLGNPNVGELERYMTKIAAMLHHEGLASKTVLMPVSPWGRFTTALNAALVKAVDGGYDVVAYQSLEFRVSPAAVTQLLAFMVPGDTRGGDAGGGRTLVVGPAMTGHAFAPGTQAVRGRTVPWNTFALWSVQDLALTGFPAVGDGDLGEAGAAAGGVEEVSTINLLQHLRPSLRAVLVKLGGSEGASWLVENFASDPQRRQWHEDKMRSKDERPAAQMARLGVPAGSVLHVAADDTT